MTTHLKTPFSAAIRSALLIDLDNVTITRSGYLDSRAVERLLRSTQTVAGPVDWTIAVAPEGSILQYAPVLAQLGIRWRIVPCLPDAADAAIVEIARDLASHGYCDFVVASADGYFDVVASMGTLRVISRAGQPVSQRLRRCASELMAA
jgi:hypothetical protein